jgi:hypothetical protein
MSFIRAISAAALCVAAAWSADVPLHFLAANDDTAAPFPPNTVSLFTIGAEGGLTSTARISTGGNGMAGGYFGASRILITARGSEGCIYASNSQSESISGIDARTRKLAGPFRGSHADTKLASDGIGLAAGAAHLYAAFSGSGNIGTFQMQPDCALEFMGDIHAQGLAGGTAEGMAVHGNLLVAAYGDGSIESFNVSAGTPVSNGDARFDQGRNTDCVPDAVDITRDGRFAVFGCSSAGTAVEISDISSGKLTAPVAYNLGVGWNSGSVRLSPDERLLYISNNSGGRVTAAFFDKVTGKVRPGCVSHPLRGFYSQFSYIGAVATELAEGAGGLLYVPELGIHNKSYIGLLRLAQTTNGCTLTETASPVTSSPTSAWLSIGVYPPRSF